MSTQHNDGGFAKGMVIGALVGGAVGAITALLFAPKPGRELRREIADRSTDLYNDVQSKAGELLKEKATTMSQYVNEGRVRADELVNTTKQQAGHLLYEAESLIREARGRVATAQHDIKDNVNRFQEAARAGKEAFAESLKTNSTHTEGGDDDDDNVAG